MGKKSREKKAKQLERDRKREEGEAAARVTSDEASSSSTAHHHTPAAAEKPSTDDTQADEPASTPVIASDSTAAVGEKLRAFCQSCVERLADDIKTWANREFSGSIAAAKAAAERGDAKAQYAIGFMIKFADLPGGNVNKRLGKAVAQGYADAFLWSAVCGVKMLVSGNCPQGQEEAYNDAATNILTASAVKYNSAEAQYIVGMFKCFRLGCARSKPGMLKTVVPQSRASGLCGGAVGAGRVVPPGSFLRLPRALRPPVHQTRCQAEPRRVPRALERAVQLRVLRRRRRPPEVLDVPRDDVLARRSTSAKAEASAQCAKLRCRTRRLARARSPIHACRWISIERSN
jgi:hypothetical protein